MFIATKDHRLIDQAVLDEIRTLPKIELHRHLEGSVRLKTLIDIARQFAFEMPDYDVETLRPFVQMMPDETRDSRHFLAKFATLRQFFRSAEVIQRIASEAVIDAAHDNVKYLELRFTPKALGTIIKAEPAQVVDWVCEATQQAARAHDIEVRLIVSMNRHESVTFGEQVVQAAVDHYERGVVGVDLAGQEEGHPASPFASLFREAREAGLGVTVHAGEWEGAESIREAVEQAGAMRVGHGIRAFEDVAIMDTLIERGIVLEVCPSSNFDSGVVSSLTEHPLPHLTAQGVLTTINTDDPLISNITLSEEMTRAINHMAMSVQDLKASMIRAAHAAFLPEAERRALVERFQGWLGLEH